jgi:hypothetical protein
MGIYGVAGERCREVFWEKCYILVAGCSVSHFWGSGSSIHSMIWARPTALFILGLPKM